MLRIFWIYTAVFAATAAILIIWGKYSAFFKRLSFPVQAILYLLFGFPASLVLVTIYGLVFIVFASAYLYPVIYLIESEEYNQIFSAIGILATFWGYIWITKKLFEYCQEKNWIPANIRNAASRLIHKLL